MPRRECAFLIALLGLPAHAADFNLTRRGIPTAAIVISSSAKAEERLAASELQLYVRKISGATLPIATSAASASVVPNVRIGVHGSDPVGGFQGERPPADGFALQTKGNTLYVVGGDARGALYGTYELIEGSLGVRWFMPGELGEDVPSVASLPLPVVDKRAGPAFGYVGGLIWAGGPGSADWERRMRGRVGPPMTFGHNWANIVRFTPQALAANPELFAEVNGVRGLSSQLCSAHPDVVRLTIEAARRYFDQNPATPLFSISPNDGYGFCEDARCRAVDALYGISGNTLSDRLAHYANEVLAQLGTTHPGKQVGIYAYATHVSPPQRVRPAAGYAAMVAKMPWEFCHVHAVADPACAANRRFNSWLQGWNSVTQHSGVYEYYGHFFVSAMWPIVHAIRRDIPYFHQLGVKRVISETQQHWATQGLNFYVAAKLLWNPQADVDALLAEYFERFYGKAATPMRRYFDRWEEAMIATAAEGDGGYEWLRMFTNAMVAETGQYLAEAERLAGQDREKVQRRVAFVKLGHGYTDAWTQIIEASRRGDAAAALAWAAEGIRRAHLTERSEPQALFLFVVDDQTRYLASIAVRGQLPWVFLRPTPAERP